MSYWTYVTGVIEIDSYAATNPMADYITRTVLAHLPKVSGSEGYMKCYVIVPDGHNVSSSHNELMEPVSFGLRNVFETQTKRLIVLDGNLRDRFFEETFSELNKFLNRLSKRLSIYNVCVQLTGFDSKHGKHRCYIFNDQDSYSDMFEWNDDERRWTDYLWPELDPETGYPKRLLEKEEFDFQKGLKDSKQKKKIGSDSEYNTI